MNAATAALNDVRWLQFSTYTTQALWMLEGVVTIVTISEKPCQVPGGSGGAHVRGVAAHINMISVTGD